MRILHVNFAPLSSPSGQSGGISGYCQTLARYQRDLGHTVGALSSGVAYEANAAPGVGDVFWRGLGPWEGIERFEIANSPFLAPALWNYARAGDEVSSPALDSVVRELARTWKPDVVHIHTLEGLSASCIGAFRSAGAKVLVSLHNHFSFCPQVYLMRGRRAPCADYEGGLACVDCEATIDVEREQLRRAGTVESAPPSISPPAFPPILRFDDDGSPTPGTATLLRDGHPLWAPLDNIPPDPALARRSVHALGERRRAVVGALNGCDRVIAVSDFVARLALAMGVTPERLKTQRIACEHRGLAKPRQRADGTLRLVFLGFNNYYKGLHMLVDALALLEPEMRARIHLGAFGPGCPAIRERAEAIRPRLLGLDLRGQYTPDEIPTLLSERDVGVVPSVWWDNGPQTLIEMQNAGLPVLGANLGGIPDLIRHGVNGLLFRGNDRGDASVQIGRLLTEPGLIDRLRRGVTPGQAPREHARDVVDLYAETLELPA